MENNYYHYAGTISKVLEQYYNVTNTVDTSIAGKWWCGVVIFPTTKGGTPLLEKFEEEIKSFVSVSNVKLLTFTYAPWCIGIYARAYRSAE